MVPFTLRRAALASVVGVLLSLVSIASFADDPPMPPDLVLDPNGVDLATGKYSLSHTDLGIGPSDGDGLSYTRYETYHGTSSTNFTIVL